MHDEIRTGIVRLAASVALLALSVAMIDPGPAFAQAPQSKFAEVNGVRLHYLIAGKGDPVRAAARLCRNQPYVAAADRKTVRQAHRDRARPARLRPIRDAGRRLHQGGDGAGHPRADEKSQLRSHPPGRPRYRADGRLCLCGAIPCRGRPAGADGSLPARGRRLEQRLSAARSLALPFLRQDAAGAGDGPRADLSRTFLE